MHYFNGKNQCVFAIHTPNFGQKSKNTVSRRCILMFNLDLTCRGGLIRPGRLFSNLSSKRIVVQTWFCYWCKHLSSGNLSDTLNMPSKSTKNFQRPLKKSFNSKQEALSEYSKPIFSFIFSKSQFVSHFLKYSLIDASCGYDFFTDANIKVGRFCKIPWTCP